MAIETEYLSMMPDTITLYATTTLDAYGKRTFSSTGTSYRCRIQAEAKMVRDAQGREVTITGKAYLYGAPTVTNDYRIVLPDGSSPVIYDVNQNGDDSGNHHTVVYFGAG